MGHARGAAGAHATGERLVDSGVGEFALDYVDLLPEVVGDDYVGYHAGRETEHPG